MKEKVKALAKQYFDEVVQIRRHIHQHPELSEQEHETAKYIASVLDKRGIAHQSGIADTGIVAYIYGKHPEKRCIALRADMDALPIAEKTKLSFQSVNQGVMHACGHDAHMASLLGAMFILQDLKNEFEGTIKCIFQPSEEQYPGGAIRMIKEGVLENPKPDCIFGQHVYPDLEYGKVGMKKGKYMASTDEIFITVNGKGGHGALPFQNIDPVLIASHIIVALQQIVSRNANPNIPTVVSFGKFMANGATNIIPDKAELAGIVRTFDEDWRKEVHAKIKKIATGIAESMGGSCELRIDAGYPYVLNDDELTDKAILYAKDFLGEGNVQDLEFRMTAEDFAYFSHQIPACFYRLGTRNEQKGISSSLHSATFDIEEDSLLTGMGFMAWIAVNELM